MKNRERLGEKVDFRKMILEDSLQMRSIIGEPCFLYILCGSHSDWFRNQYPIGFL